MNYMDCESTIAAIVEAMLPRFSNENIGLHMKLEFRFNNNYKYLINHLCLCLLFIRPSNYTKVFSRMPTEIESLNPIHNEMILQSDHDSCWRLDGLRQIFQITSEGCSQMNPYKPFMYSNPSISFSLFNGNPSYYQIEPFELTVKNRYEKVPVEINLVKKLSVKEASEFLGE